MKILILMIMLLTQTAWAQSFLPHDISILFPMPNSSQPAIGVDGIITPTALKILPKLEPTLNRQTQSTRLQVIAVRIDPPEIRLVWQAFKQIGNRVEALDAAVHSFHQIPNTQAFLVDLKAINTFSRPYLNNQKPLSVHPALLAEGFKGKYGTALIAFIRKYAHQGNLFKYTFMAMSVPETEWDFGGWNVVNGQPLPLTIAKVNITGAQLFINQAFHEFSGGFGPAPKDQEAFNRLVNDSYKAQVLEPQNMLAAHSTALRLENPRLETPATVDCVSCHLAQTARTWIEDKDASLAVRNVQNKFTSRQFILTNTTTDKGRTDNVHSFSYFLDMATINQRAINETAFVLERLNR
jgi:hypothetical protein